LIDNQVLSGIKALDLGSGVIPSFARTARLMGAEVYTLDIVPYRDQDRGDIYWPLDPRVDFDYERSHHIVLDLNSPDAEQSIHERTGELNLITSAHLATGTFYRGKDYYFHDGESLTMKLLSHGGVYFYAAGEFSSAYLRQA